MIKYDIIKSSDGKEWYMFVSVKGFFSEREMVYILNEYPNREKIKELILQSKQSKRLINFGKNRVWIK